MYIYASIIHLWISCVSCIYEFRRCCIYVYIYVCIIHLWISWNISLAAIIWKKQGNVYAYITCVHVRCVLIRVYIHPIHWYHFSTYQQILDKRTQKCVRHTCLNFLCGFHIHVERKYISDYWKPFLHPRAIIFKKKKKTWMRYGCLHYICTRRMCWKNVYAWFFDTISAAMGWLRLVGSLKL